MDKKTQYLDILEALSKKENKLLLGSNFRSKLFRKQLIFKKFLNGRVNLSETFWSILPESLRSTRVLCNWEDDLDIEIAFKKIFGEYIFNPIKLFGYKFYYLPQGQISKREKYLYFFGLIQLITEVILKDQYCACQYINNGSHIIDIGANIGTFSLFANHLSPNGIVYAFEPATKAFNFLKRTVEENNLSEHIHIFNKALGDKEGRTKLMIASSMLETPNIIKDSDFIQGREKIFQKSEDVSVSTLDNLFEEEQIERVDFIKIDTEGYEKQVILGAEKTIKKFTPIIACSAYHLKDDKTKVPKLVKSINPNYKFKLVNRAEEDLIFWV